MHLVFVNSALPFDLKLPLVHLYLVCAPFVFSRDGMQMTVDWIISEYDASTCRLKQMLPDLLQNTLRSSRDLGIRFISSTKQRVCELCVWVPLVAGILQ